MTQVLLNEQQILDAVAAAQPQAVDMLQELVAHPSLLGQEDSAQTYMAGMFAGMGLRVDCWRRPMGWTPPRSGIVVPKWKR